MVVTNGPPFQEYWYGAVPPVTAVTVALPFGLPQMALVTTTLAEEGPVTVPMIKLELIKHPLASFTITAYVPPAKPVAVLPDATALME